MSSPSVYGSAFQEGIRSGSRASAEVVVPHLVAALRPQRVVDVGCGVGSWLSVFAEHGVEVQGCDGDYVDRSALLIPADAFTPIDLSTERVTLGEFDLAMSLEVAEHLPPSRSETFVADLVSMAPSVLFSAAIPGQGGTDHTNERWQGEWSAMFAAHGYEPVDMLRNAVWNSRRVEWWYAQNMLLYVRDVDEAGRLRELTDQPALPLDIVHPGCLREAVARETGLKRSVAHAWRGVGRKLRGR